MEIDRNNYLSGAFIKNDNTLVSFGYRKITDFVVPHLVNNNEQFTENQYHYEITQNDLDNYQIKGFKKVVFSYDACCALTLTGELVTWGANGYGGWLGYTSENSEAINIEIKKALQNNVKDVYSNYHGFIAVKEDGSVYTWGAASSQLKIRQSLLSGNYKTTHNGHSHIPANNGEEVDKVFLLDRDYTAILLKNGNLLMTSNNTNSTHTYGTTNGNYSSIPTNFKSFVDIRYLSTDENPSYTRANSEISHVTGSRYNHVGILDNGQLYFFGYNRAWRNNAIELYHETQDYMVEDIIQDPFYEHPLHYIYVSGTKGQTKIDITWNELNSASWNPMGFPRDKIIISEDKHDNWWNTYRTKLSVDTTIETNILTNEAKIGAFVDVSGNYMVIGNDNTDNNTAGRIVVICENINGTWTNVLEIGPHYYGLAVSSLGYGGRPVAVDGSRVVIGDWKDSNNYGAVYVYEKNGQTNTWYQADKLTIDSSDPDYGQNTKYGWSVNVSGDYLITALSNISKIFVYKDIILDCF